MARMIYIVPNPDYWFVERLQFSKSGPDSIIKKLSLVEDGCRIKILSSDEKYAKDNAMWIATNLQISFCPYEVLSSRFTDSKAQTEDSKIDLIAAVDFVAEYCEYADIIIVAINKREGFQLLKNLAAKLSKNLTVDDNIFKNYVLQLEISNEEARLSNVHSQP